MTVRKTAEESVLQKAPEHWTFFRQWLRSPLSIAAISPSSQHLARCMLAELPPDARRVIELGGGTGVFTAALLQHGIAPEDLLVLELNPELHRHLAARFPQLQVVCADARELPRIVAQTGFADGRPADAVLSGLGLLSMGRDTQCAILKAAFAVLAPHGRMVQFTYGPTCPVRAEVLEELGLEARRGQVTWRNVPPAAVWVFTRKGEGRAARPPAEG
ncbi:MAG: phospholipid methyltransferase [Lysobacteraceae bacterium]|nr:MAG: phospholipid methyltransferase [Xanthomonadaceae bacterium]